MATGSAATFLFADIAGFTALTEAHGDEHAVQLVDDFAAVVQAELPTVGGEYVKTVGDALMLRVPDPGDPIRLGLWITRNAMGGHQAPSVRAGANFGSAVERSGDYFGTTINVAARVSALARGGELLVTGNTAALAPDLDGVLYESRGRQALRNIAEPDDPGAYPPLNVTAWEELYAELTALPGTASGPAPTALQRTPRGAPSTQYRAKDVARVVRLWADGALNQSEIAAKTELPRTVIRRIGRLVDAGVLWFDSHGRLLLGKGTEFRAAEETVSLRDLERDVGLKPFAPSRS